MTIKDILNSVRVYLNDIDRLEYKDEELIVYANDALEFIEDGLAQSQSSINLEAVDITETTTQVPYDLLKIDKIERDSDRVKLVYRERSKKLNKGEYSLIGDKLYIHEQDLPCVLYLHIALERFSEADLDKDMNIYYPLIAIIKEYITIKALHRLEYNTQQEDQRMQSVQQSLSEVIKKRDGLVIIENRNYQSGGLCSR